MKKLESMEITPGANGGASILHRFKREISSKRMGEMSMGSSEPETHVFGPGDGAKVMAHVAKHLNMPGLQAQAEGGAEPAD
jgi:hypothetical protein